MSLRVVIPVVNLFTSGILLALMKVLLYGRTSKNIEELVKNSGIQIAASAPDVIISYGGDGTLLSSERKYPGIPKLPIRDNTKYTKCERHREKLLLKLLSENKLRLKEYEKIETTIENQTIQALNDFVIRNKEAVHAIRFEAQGKYLIGDGIVISTPLGSTGYYKSITQSTFSKGFRVAFNNTTEKVKPLVLGPADKVIFKLIRGHGGLTYDNSHYQYTIKEGTRIIFKQSSQKAKIYIAESLRCPDCELIRS